jgi:hypothetical protein
MARIQDTPPPKKLYIKRRNKFMKNAIRKYRRARPNARIFVFTGALHVMTMNEKDTRIFQSGAISRDSPAYRLRSFLSERSFVILFPRFDGLKDQRRFNDSLEHAKHRMEMQLALYRASKRTSKLKEDL